MKILNSTVKIIILALVAGILFFSCSLDSEGDYGTLVVSVPGSGASRAVQHTVSPEFSKTLSYRIDCNGPRKVTQIFPYGTPVSVTLLAGNWNITVSVLNAAGQIIGYSPATVIIESGKTAVIPMSIKIDATRNSITSFGMSWYNLYEERISSFYSFIEDDPGGSYGKITLYVGENTGYDSVGDITVYFIHTGAKIVIPTVIGPPGSSLTSGSSLPFIDLLTYGLKVTAEDGNDRIYTIEVKEVPYGGWNYIFYTNWNDIPWASYNLPDLSQPSGTELYTAVGFSEFGASVVYAALNNADNTKYESLLNQIIGILGPQTSTPSSPGSYRTDTFTFVGIGYSTEVILNFDSYEGTIDIEAFKYTFYYEPWG